MIRKIKYAAAIGIALVLIPAAAVAQAPADQPAATASAAVIPPDQQPTKEQLTKLFELMRVQQQVKSVLTMMQSMMQQQISAQIKEKADKVPSGSLTPDQQTAIAKISDKYMQKAFNLFTIDELLDDMAGIYQRHVSRTDVEAMIAFYSSAPGQHLLDAQPAILKEYMPVVMQRVQERGKALNEEEAKEMEEITGSHMGRILDAPPPPPPPPQPAK